MSSVLILPIDSLLTRTLLTVGRNFKGRAGDPRIADDEAAA
jgi:hypothetical protein